MRVEEPVRARADLERCAVDVVEAVRPASLSGEFDQELVYPCEAVERLNAVDHAIGGGVNDGVEFSPYVAARLGFLDVATPEDAVGAVRALRDALSVRGWTLLEEAVDDARTGDLARLLIEAPRGGFGARVAAVITAEGAPRVTVILSSPCLRHPHEIETI